MKRGGDVGTGIKTGLKVVSPIKYEDGGAEILVFKNFSAIQIGTIANINAKALNKMLTAITLKKEIPGTQK